MFLLKTVALGQLLSCSFFCREINILPNAEILMVSFLHKCYFRSSIKETFFYNIWFLDLVFYITECSIKTAAESITFQNVLWILADPETPMI